MSDAAPRTRRYANGQARHQVILDAALEEFVRHSVGGTTMRQIARSAGLSPSGLHRHFRDTSEILLVLVERFLATGEQRTGHHPSGPTDSRQPTAAPWSAEELVSMARHNLESPKYVALFTTLLGTATNPNHPAHGHLAERYATLRHSLGPFDDVPPDSAVRRDSVAQATRLLAGWDGLLIQFAYDPSIDVPGHLGAHFDGLRGRRVERFSAPGPRLSREELLADTVADDVGYARGRERRAAIVEEATRAFSREGFHGSTFAELAEATGIAKSMLLHYFPTKELLLEAVLSHHEATTLPDRLRPGVSPRDELLDFVGSVESNLAVPGMVQTYAVLSGEGAAPQHPAHSYVRRRQQRLRSYLVGVFELLASEGSMTDGRDPIHEAVWLQSMSDGLQLQWLYDRESIDLGARLREHLESVFA